MRLKSAYQNNFWSCDTEDCV